MSPCFTIWSCILLALSCVPFSFTWFLVLAKLNMVICCCLNTQLKVWRLVIVYTGFVLVKSIPRRSYLFCYFSTKTFNSFLFSYSDDDSCCILLQKFKSSSPFGIEYVFHLEVLKFFFNLTHLVVYHGCTFRGIMQIFNGRMLLIVLNGLCPLTSSSL